MRKVVVLLLALTLTMGTQAQVGRVVGGALKKKMEQTLEKKVGESLGVSKQESSPRATQQSTEEEMDENHVPTPEEVMAMVPQIPAPQQLAEYACEQNRANQRTLKVLANPTTTFVSKMVVASASGYVVMMGGAKAGSLYNYDEHLFGELGISEEQYNNMSDEDKQELTTKYANELLDRYLRTAERLASDEEYSKLMEQYTALDKEIETKYGEVDSICGDMWQKNYGAKKEPSENDRCAYFQMAAPLQHKVVVDVMKVRKDRQLPIAKKMDARVQELANRYPEEVYVGFYNQGGLCATSYVGDAMRLVNITIPR
ncbi:MAG: hypothetical protein J6X79_00855 [Bacteroidales bacterium]|nr:hypothetical protein [Bacteroidales bacterium]